MHISEIQSVTIEIEDFLSFQDILIRAIEQINIENNTFNSTKSSMGSVEIIESKKDQIALNILEKRKAEKKINLKVNPDLYKIRIGKKKTGLPNYDYPPINIANRIKSSNFTTLSVEFEELHLDNKLSCKNVNPNIIIEKNSKENYFFLSGKGNNLNEKLISRSTINGEEDLNFSSELKEINGVRGSKAKKCCDKCLIF